MPIAIMKRGIASIAAVLCTSLSGCFIARTTTNEPLREQRIGELIPGRTTAREVTERLGAPNEVVQLGHRTAYRYDFTNTKRAGFTVIVLSLLNEDTRSDRLWLFFDEKDVLTHAGKTFEGAKTEYAMPWDD